MPPKTKLKLTEEQCTKFIQDYKNKLANNEESIINPISGKPINVYPIDELKESHMAFKILNFCKNTHSLSIENISSIPIQNDESAQVAASTSSPKQKYYTKEDIINSINKNIITDIPSIDSLINHFNIYNNQTYNNSLLRIIITFYRLLSNVYNHEMIINEDIFTRLIDCKNNLIELNNLKENNNNRYLENLIMSLSFFLRHINENADLSPWTVSAIIDVFNKAEKPHHYITGEEKKNILGYLPTLPKPKRISFFVLDTIFDDIVTSGMHRHVAYDKFMTLIQYYNKDDIIAALSFLNEKRFNKDTSVNYDKINLFINYFMKYIMKPFKHPIFDKDVSVHFMDVKSYFYRILNNEDSIVNGINSHYFTKNDINAFLIKNKFDELEYSDSLRYEEYNNQLYIEKTLNEHNIEIGSTSTTLSRDYEYIYKINTFNNCIIKDKLLQYYKYKNYKLLTEEGLIHVIDTIKNNINELNNENTFVFVIKILYRFLDKDSTIEELNPYFYIFGSFLKEILNDNNVEIYCNLITNVFYVNLKNVRTLNDFNKQMKNLSFIEHVGFYDGIVNRLSSDNFNIVENLTLINLYCVFNKIKIKKIYSKLFNKIYLFSNVTTKQLDQRLYQYEFVFSLMQQIHEKYILYDYSDLFGYNKNNVNILMNEFLKGAIIKNYSPTSSIISSSNSNNLNNTTTILKNIITDVDKIPKEFKSYYMKLLKVNKIINPTKNCNNTKKGIENFFKSLYSNINLNRYDIETLTVIRGQEFKELYILLLTFIEDHNTSSNSEDIDPADIFILLKNLRIKYQNELGQDLGGLWNEFFTNATQQMIESCFIYMDDSDRYTIKKNILFNDDDKNDTINYELIGIILAIIIVFNIKLNGKISYSLLLFLLAETKNNNSSSVYLDISKNYQSMLYMLDTNSFNYIKLFNNSMDEINIMLSVESSKSLLETPNDYIKYINKYIKDNLEFHKDYMINFKQGFNKIICENMFKSVFGNEPLVLFNLSEIISLQKITINDINLFLKKQRDYLINYIDNRYYNDNEKNNALMIFDKYKNIILNVNGYLSSDKIEELLKIYPNTPKDYNEFLNAFLYNISGFKSIKNDVNYKFLCSRNNYGIEYHTCFYSIDIPISLSEWSQEELLYMLVSDVSSTRNNVA